MLKPSLPLIDRRMFMLATLLSFLGPRTPFVFAQDLPPELSNFVASPNGTLFTGSAGQWDSLIRERGWIMKDASEYRMWYTGYNPDDTPVQMKLGYATSPDGIVWTRRSAGPAFEDAWVEDMMIVRHADKLYMFAEGANDQAQLLTSDDGIRWTRVGKLDVRLNNGDEIPPGPYGTPTAFYEDATWHLFYERRDQGIWHATSDDMKVWTNVSDDPVILPGPEEYDRLMIAMNQIIKLDGRYYAVLHGTGSPAKPRDWCTYFAVSDDLHQWKKAIEGPIFPVTDNKSSGVLVPDGSGFRMYTMHGKVELHR